SLRSEAHGSGLRWSAFSYEAFYTGWRAHRHNANAITAPTQDPADRVTRDPLSKGTSCPNTAAEIMIETHDCTDAAEPRARGKRSSIRRLSTGCTNWTPTAMIASNNCCNVTGGVATRAVRASMRAEPARA